MCVEAGQWDVNWAVKRVYCVWWLYSAASVFLFDLSTPSFRSATLNYHANSSQASECKRTLASMLKRYVPILSKHQIKVKHTVSLQK